MTKQTKIMVFGTFDVIHPGHLSFFRQARKLTQHPFLIVSVARDINVKKIKGVRSLFSESTRARKVKATGLVDKVVLGNSRGYIGHIVKEHPDIIALGYDQKVYTRGLGKRLKERGLKVKIVRLKSYKPHTYKSSLIKKVSKVQGVSKKGVQKVLTMLK